MNNQAERENRAAGLAKRPKEAKNKQRISRDLRRAAAAGIPLPVVQAPSIVVLPVPFWHYPLPPLGIIPFQPPLPLLPLPPARSALPASSTAAHQAGSSHQPPVSKQLIDDSSSAVIHMKTAADFSTSTKPPLQHKKQRLDVDDLLVPVNPITALKNLIDLPKSVHESQDELTELFTVSTTFKGHQFMASDTSDFYGAKLKLASQILHYYILHLHAFSSDLLINGSITSHRAKIIEGNDSAYFYIVGQERNEVTGSMYYSLYELKPGVFTSRRSGLYLSETVMEINGTSFLGTGKTEELAKKDAIRRALLSFTPEDMLRYSSGFTRPYSLPSSNSLLQTVKIDHHPPSANNKTNLRFFENRVLDALTRLEPRTTSEILMEDAREDIYNLTAVTGLLAHTARVIIGDVSYEASRSTVQKAKEAAAIVALSNLDADKADELARLLPGSTYLIREQPATCNLERVHAAVENINNKTKLRFVKHRVHSALSLLEPDIAVKPTGDVTGIEVKLYTAKVTLNGVSYEAEGTKETVRNEASFKALLDLDADEADKLANLLPPGYLHLNNKKAGRSHQSTVSEQLIDDSPAVIQKKNAAIAKMAQRDVEFQGSSSIKREAGDPEVSNQAGSSNNTEEGEDHSFGDYISSLVEDAYQSIVKEDRSLSTYKALAGIVMSNGVHINESQVICVATGDHCIMGRNLSVKGEAINDCHAVVLARRGLVSFLYDQLEKYGSQPEESVFEPAGNVDGLPFRLKIKAGTLFHLYVSSPPCGDACLIPSTSLNGEPVRLLGGLQAKVEDVDGGTAPISADTIQTMDNIALGQLLKTMSCSDKMARWNVVGAQGSLLSHLIYPVYFHSVVIGNPLNPESVKRAITGRIMRNLKDIPAPFMIMQPTIATTSMRKSFPFFTPKFSICWVKGWIHHEMIDCIKGKTLKMDGQTGLSELCKSRFFKRFLLLASSNPEWRRLILPKRESGSTTYGEMKAAAEGFRKTSDLLMESFTAVGLGGWMKKPSELDLFQIYF